MAPSQQFQYQALSSARSTRLVTILPARQRDSDIRIELSEFTLDSGIEYEVLSYTWGDQEPTRDIICNGMILRVTRNVYLALRRLRSDKGRKRVLWIDALSINQQDEAEKTAQVSEMGLIYTQAQRVNVWLGYPTAAMEKFFEFVRLKIRGDAWVSGIDDAHIPELRDELLQFCSAPYWARIWTIQEVVFSTNCWVYFGDAKPIKMNELQFYLFGIEREIKQRWQQLGRTQGPGSLYPAWRGLGSPTKVISLHKSFHPTRFGQFRTGTSYAEKEYWSFKQPTAEILRLLMTKKAKNPHDLVFACRALFPSSFGQIVVDYQRELSEILIELTAHIIPQTDDGGSLLGLVSLCPPVPRAPSWALNLQWDGPPKIKSHYCGIRHFWTPREKFHQTARVLPDGKTLCLTGIVVDHITLVSDLFPTYHLPSQEKWHNDVHTLLLAWRSVCASGGLKSTFEEGLEYIFYAPANSEAIFESWLETVSSKEVCRKDADPPLKASPALHEWLDDPSNSFFRLDTEDILGSSRSEDLMSTIHSPAISDSRLYITNRGRMGLGRMIQHGDAIALISNCELPLALRPVEETSRYTLGQPSVLQGATLGEEWPTDDKTGLGTIEIV